MATSTQTISGVVTTPGGSPVTSGYVQFKLSSPDGDVAGNESLPKMEESVEIGVDGSFTVELWPNTRGYNGTIYSVHVQRKTPTGPVHEKLGNIQVGESGPYDLADLLSQQIPPISPAFYHIMTQVEYDAIQGALDLKAPKASPTFTGTVSGISKSMVGLGNVDNTSDAAKPVSTAQALSIDGAGQADRIDALTKYARRIDGSSTYEVTFEIIRMHRGSPSLVINDITEVQVAANKVMTITVADGAPYTAVVETFGSTVQGEIEAGTKIELLGNRSGILTGVFARDVINIIAMARDEMRFEFGPNGSNYKGSVFMPGSRQGNADYIEIELERVIDASKKSDSVQLGEGFLAKRDGERGFARGTPILSDGIWETAIYLRNAADDGNESAIGGGPDHNYLAASESFITVDGVSVGASPVSTGYYNAKRVRAVQYAEMYRQGSSTKVISLLTEWDITAGRIRLSQRAKNISGGLLKTGSSFGTFLAMLNLYRENPNDGNEVVFNKALPMAHGSFAHPDGVGKSVNIGGDNWVSDETSGGAVNTFVHPASPGHWLFTSALGCSVEVEAVKGWDKPGRRGRLYKVSGVATEGNKLRLDPVGVNYEWADGEEIELVTDYTFDYRKV